MLKLKEGDIIQPIASPDKLMVVHYIRNGKCDVHFMMYNGKYSTDAKVGNNAFIASDCQLSGYTNSTYRILGNINDVFDRWRKDDD